MQIYQEFKTLERHLTQSQEAEDSPVSDTLWRGMILLNNTFMMPYLQKTPRRIMTMTIPSIAPATESKPSRTNQYYLYIKFPYL